MKSDLTAAELTGRRVLLIVPEFFGYEAEIRLELERRGARVDLLPDRPFRSNVLRAAAAFIPQMAASLLDSFYLTKVAAFGAAHYDIILLINGQTVSQRICRYLRETFPRARMVLYMWDSFDNRPARRHDLLVFDEAFTFDPVDARQYGLRLRPLFFGPGFNRTSYLEFQYHLSFIGTAHSDRFAVIRRLRSKLAASIDAYWYLHLQAPWVYYVYRLYRIDMLGANASDFQYQALNRQEVNRVFAQSRAIIDIEHPRQRGLTMRTLETLGAGKKLITTNARVRDYDFFHPDNVCVIERRDPRLSAHFLDSPPARLADEVYDRYSLAGWVSELLGNRPPRITSRDEPRATNGKRVIGNGG